MEMAIKGGTCGIKYKDCKCCLEYTNLKDDLILYKYLCCHRNHQNVKKRFVNTYKFSNHDINKFILFLQKDFYPCEYTNDWEKFNEISLLEEVLFLQSPKYRKYY